MKRREFLTTSVETAIGLSLLGPCLLSPSRARAESEIYKKASAAIDTLTISDENFNTKDVLGAGITSLVVDIKFNPKDYPSAKAALKNWHNSFKSDNKRRAILTAKDFDAARKHKQLGIVLASQYASILGPPTYSKNDQNLERLRDLHKDGLRLLNLTHNDRTLLGDGYWENTNAGLSRIGVEVVKEMGRLGMIVDLSHCGDATTNEAIKVSEKPCIISHAGCRALRNMKRNKSDTQIKALADKGGVFCIYNISHWLTTDDKSKVEHVIKHIEHVIKIAGEDHVGFGSDGPPTQQPDADKKLAWFQNIVIERGFPNHKKAPLHMRVRELDSPRRLEVIAHAMEKRGHKARVIEKVIGGNFERLFKDVVG